MTKTEFFKTYGPYLHVVFYDNSEFGDFLILHPEEVEIAKKLLAEGLTIVSVHENEDGEDLVDVSQPCDFGSQPFKLGYFAINTSIRE